MYSPSDLVSALLDRFDGPLCCLPGSIADARKRTVHMMGTDASCLRCSNCLVRDRVRFSILLAPRDACLNWAPEQGFRKCSVTGETLSTLLIRLGVGACAR